MKRVATGLVIGILWLLLLLYGGTSIFWLFILAVSAGLLYEFTCMALRDFSSRDRAAVVILGLFPVAASFFGTFLAVNFAVLLAMLLLFLHVFYFYRQLTNVQQMIYRGIFAIVYPGLLAAHTHLLRLLPDGANWLLFLSVVIIASDSGAYYGGTMLGRHKLCPAISPGKTLEGLAAGLLAAAIAAAAVGWMVLDGRKASLLLLAVGLALVGVAGDLLESVIKRTVGVKDSGNLLPGHGGLFDRLDALLLAVPVLYYILAFGLLS